MLAHPIGQVIAEAMNHITILAWTGGKGKRMEYKILNEKYRIVAAGIPRKTPGVSIYYNHADVIFINDDAIGLGELVELFCYIPGSGLPGAPGSAELCAERWD